MARASETLVGEKTKLFLAAGSLRSPCHRAKAKPDRLVARSLFSVAVSVAVRRANDELAIAPELAPASPVPASVPVGTSIPATSCQAFATASVGLATTASRLTVASSGLPAAES